MWLLEKSVMLVNVHSTAAFLACIKKLDWIQKMWLPQWEILILLREQVAQNGFPQHEIIYSTDQLK